MNEVELVSVLSSLLHFDDFFFKNVVATFEANWNLISLSPDLTIIRKISI